MTDLIHKAELFNRLSTAQTLSDAFVAIQDMPTVEAWIPVTAETMPSIEGYYYVIDNRGQIAYYVFNDSESSREYWMRCAKAWMPEGGEINRRKLH